MTEGDVELELFEVLEGAVRYKTRNGREKIISNLNDLPPYKIVKGETDLSCSETISKAWVEIGIIFQNLVEQRFNATGNRNCWNNSGLCNPRHGCEVGDGVLVFNSSLTLRGQCLGADNDYPMCCTITSSENSTSTFNMNPMRRYLIHGNTDDGYEIDLINLPRKEIFEKYGLNYCPSQLVAGNPITVSVDSGRYLGQFALVPSGGQAEGDFSVRYEDGRRRTTYFTHDAPKVRVRIRNSRDLVLSTRRKANLTSKVVEKEGQVTALSNAGKEVSGSVLLCYRSLLDIQVQFCDCAVFRNLNGLCYSSGVLFENADELRKYFFPTGNGLYFNSYTGRLGSLRSRARRVHFNVDSMSDEGFVCPRGKFRVAGYSDKDET